MSAFYVSTTGSDLTGDGTQQRPFATLSRAQAAMEQSATKTTYVEAGTYTLTAALSLTASDRGETFSSAPGQSAIVKGNGSLSTLVSLNNVSAVTLSGLTFENSAAVTGLDAGAVSLVNTSSTTITGNTFKDSGSDALLMIGSTDNVISNNQIFNSAQDGIEDQDGGRGNTFTNNLISGVGEQDTAGGAFYLHGTVNETISHNQIENTQGCGISVVSIGGYNGGQLYARNTGTNIANNLIKNISLNSTDAGGIYILDRTGQDTNILVKNNEVNGSSGSPYIGGIYLDDHTSGVTVTSNIVRGITNRDFQLHGGKDDTISNNIFDLSSSTGFGVLFQADGETTPNSGRQGATNDTFTKNIIVSTQAQPIAYVDLHLSPDPNVFDNLYYDPNGSFPTGLDTSPVVGNPYFVDGAGGNYALQAGSAASRIGFVAIDQAAIGLVAGITPPPAGPPAANPPVSVGTGPDTIVLGMSEDAYLGDAQFTVKVDGHQIGGDLTATARHSQGQTQLFTLNGTFGTGAHTIAINFINDAYAGSASTDRNLYVDTIQANGLNTTENALQAASGTKAYLIPAMAGSVTPPSSPPPETLSGTGATNTLTGNGGDDTYLIGGGDSFDTVINDAPGLTFAHGQLDMDMPASNLWFQQSQEDLLIGVLGGRQQVLIKNWFLEPSAQLTEVKSADGLFLDTGLQSLVQAMSRYAAAHPGFTPAGAGQNVTALPGNSDLLTAYQAAWHN